MKKIVVLTGAGISAESGLKTFRDSDGLWEGHDVTEVATFEGFVKNPALVLDFYNQRRRQLKTVAPNAAHKALARLESKFKVVIITQNVDDLHERGGSSHIIHLHGELLKAQGVRFTNDVFEIQDDILLGDKSPKGDQLRPAIVWFGEAVPKIEDAITEIQDADYVIVIGSSMQVYPAAGLVSEAPRTAKIWFIDPNPSLNYELKSKKNLTVLAEKASIGVPLLVDELLANN